MRFPSTASYRGRNWRSESEEDPLSVTSQEDPDVAACPELDRKSGRTTGRDERRKAGKLPRNRPGAPKASSLLTFPRSQVVQGADVE